MDESVWDRCNILFAIPVVFGVARRSHGDGDRSKSWDRSLAGFLGVDALGSSGEKVHKLDERVNDFEEDATGLDLFRLSEFQQKMSIIDIWSKERDARYLNSNRETTYSTLMVGFRYLWTVEYHVACYLGCLSLHLEDRGVCCATVTRYQNRENLRKRIEYGQSDTKRNRVTIVGQARLQRLLARFNGLGALPRTSWYTATRGRLWESIVVSPTFEDLSAVCD